MKILVVEVCGLMNLEVCIVTSIICLTKRIVKSITLEAVKLDNSPTFNLRTKIPKKKCVLQRMDHGERLKMEQIISL